MCQKNDDDNLQKRIACVMQESKIEYQHHYHRMKQIIILGICTIRKRHMEVLLYIQGRRHKEIRCWNAGKHDIAVEAVCVMQKHCLKGKKSNGNKQSAQ